MKVLLWFFLSGLLTLNACSGPGPLEDRRYNIIFILADDLGCPQLGCYGSDYYQTPNIDRLAGGGMRFTQAYSAAAVCSPTRASILSGKYPARLHLTDFIPGNKDSSLLLEPEWQKFLPLEVLTFAELLKQDAYKTAFFGKWHLSRQKEPPGSISHNPDKQGFDEYFISFKPSPSLPIGAWQTPENDGHNVDTITSLAIDYLTRKKESPFFLFVSHNSIHDPLMEKEDVIRKYGAQPGSGLPENNPLIAAMVERLDRSTGRIMQAVEDLGIAGRTIIIFFGDNGARDRYARQKPFRAGKGWLYEGGIREPLIVRWPGVTEPGSVSSQMVISHDLYPTFLDMAGIKLPDSLLLDGISLLPALNGTDTLNRKSLFWHYPHYHQGSGMKPASAVRFGQYKLIEWYEPVLTGNGPGYELFDLVNDVGEHNNLVSSKPELTMQMAGMLEDWKKETGAQLPALRDE